MYSNEIGSQTTEATGEAHKPRVALMGEFSAGKSTLLNMLLGQDPLPVRITATSVPPIWISFGEDAAIQVRRDGTEEPIEVSDLGDVTLEDTKFIRLWLKSDILELCDLIDMPGISDPNGPRDTWADALDEVDSVIWCTHATQAWRQSEAATWQDIQDQTNGNNILVITQFDKIVNERDRSRVLSRVRKETDGAFEEVFPVALTQAIAAENKADWQASGAADFAELFIEMLLRPPVVDDEEADVPEDTDVEESDSRSAFESRISNLRSAGAGSNDAENEAAEVSGDTDQSDATVETVRVVPRRVMARDPSSSRPQRPGGEKELSDNPSSMEGC